LGQVTGHEIPTGMPVWGYEMHLGITIGPGLKRPMLDLHGHPDGAVSADGRVMGCYLHGLFASDPFRRAFLARLGAEGGAIAYEPMIENVLDRLADHLEQHLDVAALLAAARPAVPSRMNIAAIASSAPLSRAGTIFSRSSNRAAAQPKAQ